MAPAQRSARSEVRDDVAGRYVGGMVGAGFGAGWTAWGASDLLSPASLVVRVVGIGLAVVLIVVALRRLRTQPRGSGRSMTGRRGFWLIFVAEVAAIVVGGRLLVVTGRPELVPVWVATVVGAHFLALGWLFWRGFHLLGAFLLAGAVTGLAVFLASGPHVVAITALIAAAGLLGFAVLAVTRRS